jgi:L-threonylcarbamoyladenylate synthase
MTRVFHCSRITPEELAEAASAVERGAIAVFPTDTVYGIGTTALSAKACARVYEIKKRPGSKPLPVFVNSLAQAHKMLVWNETAERLAKRFWPGQLTLILKSSGHMKLAAGTGVTIGVRMPDHPFLLKFLKACNVPLAQTSANISSEPPACDGAAALKIFDGAADYIFDCGPAAGEQSTVLDLSGEKPILLREGAIKKELLELSL